MRILICLTFFISFSLESFCQEGLSPDTEPTFRYDDVEDKGRYRVVVKSKFGIYDTQDKRLTTDFQYYRIDKVKGDTNLFIAKENYGNRRLEFLINHNNEILSKKYSYIKYFDKNERAIASNYTDSPNYNVLINKKGKEISKRVSSIEYYSKLDVYIFREGKSVWVVNHNLKTIIPQGKYQEIEIHHNNPSYFVVQKNYKKGITNLKDKVVIPIEYDYIRSSFDKNKFIVGINNKDAVIDLNNNILLKTDFDRLYNPFNNGNFMVKNKGKRGLIDQYGKVLIPVEFNKIYVEEVPNYFVTAKNGLYGIYDFDGNLVIPTIYQKLSLLVQDKEILEKVDYSLVNRLIVKKDDLYGVINMANQVIIPIEYKKLKFATSPKHFQNQLQKEDLSPEDFIYVVSEDGKSFYPINEKNERIKVK